MVARDGAVPVRIALVAAGIAAGVVLLAWATRGDGVPLRAVAVGLGGLARRGGWGKLLVQDAKEAIEKLLGVLLGIIGVGVGWTA